MDRINVCIRSITELQIALRDGFSIAKEVCLSMIIH